MSGHGWVTPNADGSKARCGGPGLCPQCSVEKASATRREREALEHIMYDTDSRAAIRAPEDAEIEAICERWGYGAVMDAAARLWQRKDPVGAFTVGPCVGTLRSLLTGWTVKPPPLPDDPPPNALHHKDCRWFSEANNDRLPVMAERRYPLWACSPECTARDDVILEQAKVKGERK